MITVNLKDIYPWIAKDEYIEITEEMYEAMKTADKRQPLICQRNFGQPGKPKLMAG